MNKVLIPLLGLLALILATPLILGKISNSHIDTKIAKLQKTGVDIKNIKEQMGYINSFREFKVKYNGNDVIIDLKFKNLPVTDAIFDVEYNGVKTHIIMNNLKNFVFLINNYKGYYKDHKFYINTRLVSDMKLDENINEMIKMIGLAIDRLQQKNP